MGTPYHEEGTFTFVFTDIANSSHLWEQFPSLMTRDVELHNQLIEAVAQEYGGHAFKSLGDGLAIVFTTPQKAILFAIAAQVQLLAEAWQVSEPFLVKLGVHTGVVQRLGGDFQGPAINRLARIMEAASPGQILVSATSYELARDYLSSESCEWKPLGPVALRGSAHTEAVLQPVGPGLLRELPLRKKAVFQTHNLFNLPFEFVGKRGFRTRLKEILTNDENRLVSVVGFGGSGKSSLANVVGWDCLPEFGERVFWADCELARCTEELANCMADAIGEALSETNPERSLVELIADRHMLLICDCCEGAALHASIFEQVLAKCPRLTILVTTRIVLGLRREQIFDIAIPGATRDREVVADAIEIFRQAAQKGVPDFVVTKTNRAVLRKLVSTLEYLPLALVICAGRLRYSSLHDLHVQVTERLLDTVKVPRQEVGRHAGLRLVIEASLALLPQNDLKTAEMVSVFEGSFSMRSAEAVMGSPDAVESTLRLVDHSLIQLSERGQSIRFKMLDSVKEYMRERVPNQDSSAIRASHAVHFLAVAGDARALFEANRTGRSSEVLRNESGNFRVAGETFLQQGMSREVTSLALKLARLYLEFGYISEFDRLSQAALERVNDPSAEAELSGVAAFAAKRRGDFPSAIQLMGRRVQACEAAGLSAELRECWIDLASLNLDVGAKTEASRWVDKYEFALNGAPLPASILALKMRLNEGLREALGMQVEAVLKGSEVHPIEAIFISHQALLAYAEAEEPDAAVRLARLLTAKSLVADHPSGAALAALSWVNLVAEDDLVVRPRILSLMRDLRPLLSGYQRDQLRLRVDQLPKKSKGEQGDWKVSAQLLLELE